MIEKTEALAAIEAWGANRAYLDNNGNYHEKQYPHDSHGPKAKWDKTAKRLFRDSSELHAVAHQRPEHREEWLEARLRDEDVPRICVTDLKRALAIIEGHADVIGNSTHLDLVMGAMRDIIGGWRPPKGPFTDVSFRRYEGEK